MYCLELIAGRPAAKAESERLVVESGFLRGLVFAIPVGIAIWIGIIAGLEAIFK